MTNVGSVSGRVQIHHTNAQPGFNWRKAAITTLVTTTALGALYSLFHFSIGSEEAQDQESTALTLRSIGEVASTTVHVLQGIAAIGLPFAMAAPLHRDHLDWDFDAFAEPTMKEAIGEYLKYGGVSSSLLQKYGVYSRYNHIDVEHFIIQAESSLHPADRAVLYRMARRAGSILGQDWSRSEEQKNFHFKEADACLEASSYAKTSSEEFSWLMLAGEALNLPIKGDLPIKSLRNACGFLDLKTEIRKEQIEIGAKIWSRAGELLLEDTEIPRNLKNYRFMSNAELQMHAVAAARCFHLAGNALSYNEEGDPGTEMYAKAYDILKNIDPKSLSDWDKVLLQREIADISYYVNQEVALIEKKSCAEAYAELAKQGFGEFELKINQSILLFQAGHVVLELKEKVTLFTQAKDVLEELWERDANLCKKLGIFYMSEPRNFYYSWLYQVRETADEYQLRLTEENSFIRLNSF